MAKRVFQNVNWTPTVAADASALANATYMAIKGGTGTQKIDILETYVVGAAAASAPTFLCLARASTIETTPTALVAPATDGPMDPATAALAAPPVTFTAAGTGPQRSAATTDARLLVAINAFGGSLRYNSAPTQQWVVLGNTAQFGETLLSAENVGTSGALSAHMVYEPY
jgi:hypothetical protein